jgi:ABC-2 type transport system ATP-binding protein
MMVATESLSKEYGGVLRVQGLDIRIGEGDIYGFLGPNGAGKSTTMKMLLGLVKPTSGMVEIMGMPFNESTRREILKSVGSLIESPSYYGHLTGQENMEIVRRLLDLPQKNIKEAIRIVRMENQMDKKAKDYSLGMKQRLGIAMALARRPKLLILDEPTNGLDPSGIEEMRELIRALPERYGMTVMISSHILSEIDRMATVIGIIHRGRLIFQENVSVLDRRREPQIVIKTSDDSLASRFIGAVHPHPQLTASGLLMGTLTDEQIGAVVQRLCSNGVAVYRVEERRESLEDIFLQLTGKELTL